MPGVASKSNLIYFIMIIVIASDIHASLRHLETALVRAIEHAVEAIIFNGDIVPKSIYFEAEDARQVVSLQRDYLAGVFLTELRQFKSRWPTLRIYTDLGNDDFWCNRSLLVEAEKEGVLALLHNRVQPLTPDLDIIGYMFVPPTPFSIKRRRTNR